MFKMAKFNFENDSNKNSNDKIKNRQNDEIKS